MRGYIIESKQYSVIGYYLGENEYVARQCFEAQYGSFHAKKASCKVVNLRLASVILPNQKFWSPPFEAAISNRWLFSNSGIICSQPLLRVIKKPNLGREILEIHYQEWVYREGIVTRKALIGFYGADGSLGESNTSNVGVIGNTAITPEYILNDYHATTNSQ